MLLWNTLDCLLFLTKKKSRLWNTLDRLLLLPK